ncbi:hypothetical protein [Jannaschia seohaensis]|uniref:Uncharacterized protein n=1 Tax=Jannaschia seohaensis TaxID=475081 RepID=A0A2Y9C8Q3_9RHOB|nr:hypothetical protein [Jannaschia seohaensis]PWJ15044.1 hypothetical protein BCF38_11161 [Jannaschia seohaensis]SSA49893.1 hypothetical protein SAMN05421539_11161 [Jannaschia seohaensis]
MTRDPRLAFARSTGSRVWMTHAVWAVVMGAASVFLFRLGGPVWPLFGCVTLAVTGARAWQAWTLWRA